MGILRVVGVLREGSRGDRAAVLLVVVQADVTAGRPRTDGRQGSMDTHMRTANGSEERVGE